MPPWCFLPFRSQMTCCLKHSVGPWPQTASCHALALLCVTIILVLLLVTSLKIPSGGLFFPRVCSMLHNTRHSLINAWMTECRLAGAILRPEWGIKMQMMMQMLTLIERQCAVWFGHNTLIWKVGRHLSLQDVVRIRESGYKHLTHSHCLRLF